jgi:DNA-binding SARP family transcriptional activator
VQGDVRLVVTLLGPFKMTIAGREVNRWRRPTAKQLCELLMVSPGCRVGRDVACEVLFPNLSPTSAANALSRALSMARAALAPLGQDGRDLLQADRTKIWVSSEAAQVEIDAVAHEQLLRNALAMGPGLREEALTRALADDRPLLEDEPYADWAIRPREALEMLRQRARLELAHDRQRGRGHAQPDGVIEAWENCLSHDPALEEANRKGARGT